MSEKNEEIAKSICNRLRSAYGTNLEQMIITALDQKDSESAQLRGEVGSLKKAHEKLVDSSFDRGETLKVQSFLKDKITSQSLLIEKLREGLVEIKHQSHHTIDEEMWRIDNLLALPPPRMRRRRNNEVNGLP